MKRPLFVIGLSFFLSSAAALVFGDNFAFSVGIVLLLAGGLSLLVVKKHRAAVAAVLFTGAVAAAVVLLQNNMWLRPVSDLADKTVYLEGRVTEIEHGSGNSRYRLEAVIPLQDSAKPVKANVMVYSFTSLSADVNDVLRGYVSLYNPKLEGKYRYRYLADRLLLFGTFHGKIEAVDRDQAPRTVGYYVSALREYLTAQNRKLLPSQEASVVNAMMIGDKSYLDRTVELDFKDSGLVHLMAVSGFHVSLFCALLGGIFRAMKLRRKLANFLCMPFLLLFMAVCGFSSSVLRAGLMMFLCLFAQIFSKRYDALNALGFAMLLICFINPYSALNISFLLSFAATVGIILLAPRLSGFFLKRLGYAEEGEGKKEKAGVESRFTRLVVHAFCVSLAAYVFTLPVMLYYFDSFSLIAPIASTLVMPLAMLLLWCQALALLFGALPLLGFIAQIISAFTALLVRMILLLTHFFASLPFSTMPVRYDFLQFLLVIFYIVAILLVAFGASKRTKRLCTVLAAAVLVFGVASAWLLRRGTVDIVSFADVDSVLVISDGKAAMVGFPQSAYGGRAISSYLRARGINELEAAVSTSMDNDAAIGAIGVLQETPARLVAMPTSGQFTEHLLKYARGAETLMVNGEGTIRLLGGVKLNLIPCSCGCACEIDVNGAKLLKTNQNCVIMNNDYGTQGIIRGWTLVKERVVNPKMKIAYDGDSVTTYTIRKKQEGKQA